MFLLILKRKGQFCNYSRFTIIVLDFETSPVFQLQGKHQQYY